MSTADRDAALAAEVEAMEARVDAAPDKADALAEEMARVMRERDAARDVVARLRAALRRFAEVFHEGRDCGICGCAWDDDGRKHFDGCAVGAALTEADR